ncbi:hypothetical protein [Candidatus Nitrospira allomarina]|uniref:Uncharacterized protein n=1 Tax=Candidatus Nitrospira allomarina TaxID=3020900 RepID=A0AA96GCZ3_9BACT|nr:hypothetical protein [Candidatus Nitrospira allomarina]WNM57910.1 hypothetical protein PP769_18350 [Candidatus Nitrospira allomarina]
MKEFLSTDFQDTFIMEKEFKMEHHPSLLHKDINQNETVVVFSEDEEGDCRVRPLKSTSPLGGQGKQEFDSDEEEYFYQL